MTSEEIYDKWLSETSDKRYLRPRRWKEMEKVIVEYNVKSVLEFGSGISTILFDSLGLRVLSYETSLRFINYVRPKCSSNVSFKHWNNRIACPNGNFDLAFVDGSLPRNRQFYISCNRSPIIAIDDFEFDLKDIITPALINYTRIDKQITSLAIFKRND